MTKRIGSSRRKTRRMLSKPKSLKGLYPIVGLTQRFSVGDKVVFKAEASVHKGLYFRRFHGQTGKVLGQVGKCYKIGVLDGGKQKIMIVNPVHVVRA